MRSFRKGVIVCAAVLGCGCVFEAGAVLPAWVQTVVGGSVVEAALFRMMDVPGLSVLYPRPPAEAVPELNELVKKTPADAQLYALRAHAEESALDFAGAERDWKAAVAHAQDVAAAETQLADFYHRRVMAKEEVDALLRAARVASPVSEKYESAEKQRAWKSFERVLDVVKDQALPGDVSVTAYKAWIERYPAEPSVRAAYVNLLLEQKRYDEAKAAIAAYKGAFPKDEVFPIQAEALVAYKQGSTAEALALYDTRYQPLWPDELIKSYYGLLVETHSLRRVLAAEQAKFASDPNDYAAAARVFALYKQQGRSDAATRTLAEYRLQKDAKKLAWSADELYTFAVLLDRAGMYTDAARYYFALADSQGKLTLNAEAAQQVGMASLVHILLAQPEQAIDLGAGNLAMYKDIATVDQGPGYWNGILSLWLNSDDPAAAFHDEEQRATPYFHRAKAAELLGVMGQRFPNAAEGPELHAALIQAYVTYGDDAAVLKAGTGFLAKYANAPQRVEIALTMADAYERKEDTASEFALYESLLTEFAAKSNGMPLTAAGAEPPVAKGAPTPQSGNGESGDVGEDASTKPVVTPAPVAALPVGAARAVDNSDAVLYSQVLERYLGRLTMNKRLPEALAVLRKQLDRNADDPLMYERLADFLQQNDLSAQQEEVYTKAIAKFNEATVYDKLARFYLRQKRREDFGALTRKVVDTFSGTELEKYFDTVTRNDGWGDLYVQLNLYAYKRFPHDAMFTRNLLGAYRAKKTRDDAAWERLIREHWTESDELRNEFFDWLGQTGKMDAELAALEKLVPDQKDVAATRELGEIDVWQSHFEAGAPLMGEVAKAYPADEVVGEEASSLYRSLAYYDPAQVERAVGIEKNLLLADPANTERMARIGDIYADSTSTGLNLDAEAQLAQAAPYWQRIPGVHPGTPDGYLQAATVFWDYFQFDRALGEIEAARRQFHQPELYGYEAGAIYENKRDEAKAVAEYVAAAAADGSSGEAEARLLILSERPVYGVLVDAATMRLAAEHPTVAALGLRIAVLKTRKEAGGIEALVDGAIARAETPQAAAEYAGFAQQHDLPMSYRKALEREIALMRPESSDATDRIALEYELVAALEASGRVEDVAQAQGIIDAVYRENPKLLGVVRRTVEFDWKHKRGDAAIAVLNEAAKDANAELAASFTVEAASKSNASAEYEQARMLIGPLLERDPYNAKLIAIYAESYALAKDDAGVRDFYLARLAMLKDAKLPRDVKRDDTALMRQGLIGAYTELKDYAGATDQHIALVSAFPEDAGVLQRAALYALRYGRQAQLVGFLDKTVAESPRDSRFAIALAQADTVFEDYAGALAAYSKAIAIRKDRMELYIARVDLEERAQAFDAACDDYDRLYLLSYKDPQWMEKAALARARQGKNDLAVKALQTGWIDGRPPAAANYFKVAKQLEEWAIIEPARGFAEQGVKLAGDDLLPKYASDGAALYARILMRERHWGETLAFLDKALAAANVSASSPSVVVEQVERKGIASVTDAEWRKRYVATRKQQAQAGYLLALTQAGATVAELYTPEEKLGYAELLDSRRANRPMEEVASTWIPAAQAAGLKDREAAWRRDVLLHGSKELAAAQLSAFNTLEDQRMDNAEHARTLEAYALLVKRGERAGILFAAEAAWRADGNHAGELRVLRAMRKLNDAPQTDERYFELLLRSNADALVAENSDAAANYALAHAEPRVAYRAIDARARQRTPVWGSAMTAVTGLFFADTSAKVDGAFHTALGDMTVAERLKRADAKKEIVGASWFYYGMRYGVYREIAPVAGDAEDYLAAGIEGHPGASESYVTLAEAYADAHKVDAALAEYDHALELANGSASIHIAKAELLWGAGRRPQAMEEWRMALVELRRLVDTRAVPESFWIDFAKIADDLRERGLGVQFKPEMEAVLRPYIVKNGDYRSEELLHSALIAVSKPALDGDADGLVADEASAAWIAGLAEAASDTGSLLGELSRASWFPKERLGALYARRLQLAEADAAKTASTPGAGGYGDSDYEVDSVRTSYLRFLIERGEFAEADRVYERTSKAGRSKGDLPRLMIELRAREGKVAELIASFKDVPSEAPELKTIAAAADALRRDYAKGGRDVDAARALREYVFAQKQALNELAAPDYLALAESRLEAPAGKPDVAGAVEVLHRLDMFPDTEYYLNLDSAAGLLTRSGHPAEAIPFLKAMADANPWKPEYRFELAQAEISVGKGGDGAAALLTAVAESGDATYQLRADAATALRKLPGAHGFGSAELTLLASQSVTAAQAERPYFVRARELAAKNAPVAGRPWILRAAIGFGAGDRLGDGLRLAVFKAEVAAGEDERALAAVEPLLLDNRGYAYRYSGRDGDVREDGDSSGVETADAGTDEVDSESSDFDDASLVMPVMISSREEKLAFSLEVAKMHERLGDDVDAVTWLIEAKRLSVDAGAQAGLQKRLMTARERLRVGTENSARRPVVQESIDQAVMVRPRVGLAETGGRP